jgi:hypothetical protein
MLDENQIIDIVCHYYENKGYTILQKLNTHEKGIDIIVKDDKTGKKMLIEAKGGTSSFIGSNRYGKPYTKSQVFDRVSKGIYTLLQIFSEYEHEENIEAAIAFADTEWFREYLNKIKPVIEKMNLNILMVGENREINSLINSHIQNKSNHNTEWNMISNSGRDYTKYTFNGERYPKNRVVLEVIRQFLKDNPKITYDELSDVFPAAYFSQGSKGVFTKYENALRIQKSDRKRHFLEKDEILETYDGIRIAVSTQWAKDLNFDKFLEKARTLGYHITI